MDPIVLDFMPDAVIVTDRNGAIGYVNRMAEQLFGYDRPELVGRPIDVLLPARFRAAHRAHVLTYFAAPRVRPMGIGLELMGLRRDGLEFPVDISLAPYRTGDETFSIAVVRDVTERKAFEERERRLQKAEEEIRQRDEVLAIASHELRAPVGSLQLQIGMLQRAATATADEMTSLREAMGDTASGLNAMRNRTALIERHTRRLARLIEELLDVSNIRAGHFPLKLEDADLADLTRETVGTLREEVERTGSRLTLAADPPVRGRWDPLRIEQALANLLLNAAKFGRGNPIEVEVEGDEERGRVLVKDEGIGIAPDDQERIFLPFERAVALGGAVGLGLGLYIARQIVHAHGGSIALRSVPGVGSTFTVELPRVPPPRA